MKKLGTVLKITGTALFVSVLAAVILTACFPDYDSLSGNDSIPAGKGQLTLSVAGPAGRTVFPAEAKDFTYSATISAAEKDPVVKALASGAVTVTLDPGFYDVVVEAKSGDTVVGRSAPANVEVKDREKTELKDILILPVAGNKGKIAWSINLPNSADDAKLYYATSAGVTATIDLRNPPAEGVTTIADPDNPATKKIISGELSLDPGSYIISTELKKTGTDKTAGKTSAVHVYPELTSAVDWEFKETSFANLVSIKGYVTFSNSNKVTISAVDLNARGDETVEDAEFTKDTGNANQWNFETAVVENSTEMKRIKLEITTAANTPAKIVADLGTSVSFGGTAAPGSDINVNLGTVTINAVDVTGAANGKLKVEGGFVQEEIEKPVPFRFDVVSGTPVTLAATPDTGYDVDTIKVGAADYTAPVTISADTTVTVTFKQKLVTSIAVSGPATIYSGNSSVPYAKLVSPPDASNQTLTWAVNDTNAYAPGKTSAAAGSIDASSGLLSPDGSLAGTTKIYVFAAANDGSNTVSPGYEVTVKAGKSWNFSDQVFITALASFTPPVTNIGGTGLDLLGTGTCTYGDQTANNQLDGYTFTKRLQFGGAGSATNRALQFTLDKPAKVIVYAQSGSAGRNLVLSRAGTAVTGIEVNAITKCDYGVQQAGTYTIHSSSNSINIFMILLEYPDPNDPVTALTIKSTTTASVTAGDGAAGTGGTLQLAVDTVTPAWADTGTLTWSLAANNNGTGSVTAASINASTGLITAQDGVLAGDVTAYAFAASNKGTGGSSITSAPLQITIKPYGAAPTPTTITWNLSDTSIVNGIAASSYFTSSSGRINGSITVDGLTFKGNNSAYVYTTASTTFNSVTYTRQLTFGTSGGGGTTGNNHVSFAVTGPCTISAILTNGNNNRTWTVHDGTSALYTSGNLTRDTTQEVSYSYTGGAGTLYVYGSGSALSLLQLQVTY